MRREYVPAGSCLVHGVDRLVGEVSVGYIPLGQGDACVQRLLRVAYVVVAFVVGRYVVEDLERLCCRRRLYDHLLKTAFERGVALDVLAELVEGGGADGLQLSACESRLEYVGRVKAALCGAGTDDGVYFVDEYDGVVTPAQFVEQLLHALLEFAAELGPRDERRHVERVYRFAAYGARHFARGYSQGKPLDDGAFAYARLAYEDGVVFLAAREYLYDALYLRLASHYRVYAAVARLLREVGAEFVEHGACGGLALVIVEVYHAQAYGRWFVERSGQLVDCRGHCLCVYAV